jgi:hypothetical protein
MELVKLVSVVRQWIFPTHRVGDEELEEGYVEVSYWEFDARRKGYGDWEGKKMSERDAYKAEMRKLLANIKNNKRYW